MLFEPAKSADPPIKLGSFDTISKNFSEHFLVAIGSRFFKYSVFAFSIDPMIALFLRLYPGGKSFLNLLDIDHPNQPNFLSSLLKIF